MASLPEQSNGTSISDETHEQLRDALLAPGGDSIITASQPPRFASIFDERDHVPPRQPNAVRPSARDDLPYTRSAPSKPAGSDKRATMTASVANPMPSQGTLPPTTNARLLQPYDGGDTQPMESQVYRDYTESMARESAASDQQVQHKAALAKAAEVEESQYSLRGGNYTDATVPCDYTAHTYQEGETGHIDLMQDLPDEQITDESGNGARTQDDEDYTDLLDSQPTQIRPGEGFEFKLPATPATAGRKHGGDGQISSSGSTSTKHMTAPRLFGETANGLTATQMFAQTQEPSSPGAICPPTVGILTRPSPNIEQRFGAFSSPSLGPTRHDEDRLVKTFPEPFSQYRSARRSSPLQDTQAPVDDFDDFDEAENSLEMKIRRQRQGRELGNRIRRQLSTVTAPPRPGSRNKVRPTPRKPPDQIDLTHSTPATAHRNRGAFAELLDQDDDPVDVVGDHGRADEPTLEDEDYPHDPNDEDDVYDEQSQSVIKRRVDMFSAEDHSHSDSEVDEQETEETRMDSDDNDTADPVSHRTNPVPNTQQSGVADSPYHGRRRLQSGVSQGTTQHSSTSLVMGTQFQDASNKIAASPLEKVPEASAKEDFSGPVLPLCSVQSSPPMSTGADAGVRGHDECVLTDGTALTSPQRLSGNARGASPLQNKATHSAGDADRDPYSTANTHLSTINSPGKLLSPPTNRSQLDPAANTVLPSPRKRSQVKLFQDIEAEAGSITASGETQNMIDDVMNSVITDEDNAFFALMRSPEPALKRRRIVYKSSRAQRTQAQDVVKPALPPPDVRQSTPAPPATMLQREATESGNDDATSVLRDSPSKANELPSVTHDQSKQVDETQAWERLGSHAVSQLIARRSEMEEKSTQIQKRQEKPAQSQNSARPAKTKVVLKKKQRRSKSMNKAGQESIVEEAETLVQLEEAPVSAVDPQLEHQHDAVEQEQPKDTTEMQGVQPQETKGMKVEDTVMEDETHHVNATTALPEIVAPERVLAWFKTDFQYYAATCVRCSPDGSCHVHFDDGTSALVPLHQVRNLDLRVGDSVKVDHDGLSEGKKNKMQRNTSWIVHELGPVAQTEQERPMGTDQRGRVTVKLRPHTKQSAAHKGSAETVTILISHVRLTATMFKQFKDRDFKPPLKASQSQSRAETPAFGMRLTETPGSRSLKVKSSMPRASLIKEEPTLSVQSSGDSAVFGGMAFAITLGVDAEKQREKQRLTTLVERNGGTVLSSGFDQLFVSSGDGDSTLTVKPQFDELGFVALITESHNRMVKYIQALALGLPALSARWLTDSLDKQKNPPIPGQDLAPLPWRKYLLAAGESAYLSGGVCSRSLNDYSIDEARLQTTIANRRKLLGDDGVLYVAPREKSLLFVTQALGSKRVKCVADLTAARNLIAKEPDTWNWVYVEGAVSKAAATLFSKKSSSKKRKRDADDGQQSEWFVRQGHVTVVNKEFVIQSLILGELLD